MAERVVLALGTKKGLFIAEGGRTRRKFDLRGPFGSGVSVYSALIDERGTGRIYGSSCNAFFGMKLLVSTDLGNKFKPTKSPHLSPKAMVAGRWPISGAGARAGGKQERVVVRCRASGFVSQR